MLRLIKNEIESKMESNDHFSVVWKDSSIIQKFRWMKRDLARYRNNCKYYFKEKDKLYYKEGMKSLSIVESSAMNL